ncbi:ERV/ALR sulfhydryl oxidase domain-containing protein [Desarmillaria tabescens]|uniref:Sulfhydryl oxidase n=1 Tax=Armillaria tabescens TaxID=1929756 RepID=A0AA39KFV6_ARMTA|nr:ERV/ALR sulfhydryl oxidase domain-containing protein [Desarmillaria tabescens]KAK0459195.1 ERV/ALR sulfhydryl oxidase domain-containing protein [Desarmillaria tabescens]
MTRLLSRFAKSFFAIILALVVISMLAFLHPPTRAYIDPWTGDFLGEGGVALHTGSFKKGELDVTQGTVIMPKLGNETAKAALGRSTWKLLHTITLRYPENPTADEREALESYFHLLSRLYPCGECAAEFQKLLKKLPPQTSSRRSAALWLCSLHNEVNERLGKPQFDCAHLDEEYDCGCGDEPINGTKALGGGKAEDSAKNSDADELTGIEMINGGR